MITLPVDRCPGCDHWRDYDLVEVMENGLLFKCGDCDITKYVTYKELKEELNKNSH